jgi:hypothetical protein
MLNTDQSTQLNTQLQRSSIVPSNGTKFKHILFMKIALTILQKLKFNTVFQEPNENS